MIENTHSKCFNTNEKVLRCFHEQSILKIDLKKTIKASPHENYQCKLWSYNNKLIKTI